MFVIPSSLTKLLIFTLVALLCLNIISPIVVYGQPLGTSAEDWQYVNGNSWAWNYSPETQINKNNVENLEVKWIYPIDIGVVPPGMESIFLNEGSTTPPIVVNGKVFVTSQFQTTYAIDAKTGKEIWRYRYQINATEISDRLPIEYGGFLVSILMSHIHGIRYWEGRNSILHTGLACDFYGIEADSGELSFWVQDLCSDIPGNIYYYRQGTSSQANIATYDSGNQFIVVLPGAQHSWSLPGDFRHTTLGVDMITQEVLWRIFSFPPQDVPTQDWALQECDIGFFQDIPCSDVAAAAPENLEWDWAFPGDTPSLYGGVTANWGQIVVDEDTGIVYTQTGNQGPYTYIGSTPGPRLYGSTIMAMDANMGQRIWWMQPFPRDPYDYDCGWSGILLNSLNLGKVYVKGCKEGRLHVLDAETGEPIYLKDIIDEQYNWGQISIAGTREPPQGGIKYHLNDPFSFYDMREMASPDNSIYCGRPCQVYPGFNNGIFGTDMTYDPVTGTLFHYAEAHQIEIIESPPPESGITAITRGYPVTNSTIVARELDTGEVRWTWYFDPGQQRSHMVATSDLLFTGFIDGKMRFFDKNSGQLLKEMALGSRMIIGPTTGQDSDGNQMIFTLAGLSSPFNSRNPGVLIGIGLDESPPGTTTTVTTTRTVTTTTTARTTLTTTFWSTLTSTTTTTSTTTFTTPGRDITVTVIQPPITSTVTILDKNTITSTYTSVTTTTIRSPATTVTVLDTTTITSNYTSISTTTIGRHKIIPPYPDFSSIDYGSILTLPQTLAGAVLLVGSTAIILSKKEDKQEKSG